ncbi:hypothetical protein [Bradyrhizobium sp. SZCCHNRI2007]|uniref:hypothetical protein n=1 Tax=Bradyrhizobium sp. SZCCHNRI2007 TaxID=3057281 RepID=UPI0028EC8079|nr:hypothetical protein [Bradyrhizobium sp. SZCCHNRI2007]
MRCLPRSETEALERKLRREIVGFGEPKSVLYYESGRRDYSSAADAIAQSAGVLSEATLLFLFSLSGDGYGEHDGHDERWRGYRRWRAAQGETRRLYDAPAHRFEAGEVALLSELIAFALDLGWDAVLTAKPGRQLLVLSHDDRLEIHRGFGGGALVRRLIAIDGWQRAER